ncbi:MAG: hypothetical protein H6828_09915 [Planctomycetes bacterium]|nr:hypothetical protein [Planctomycetota bacterium]
MRSSALLALLLALVTPGCLAVLGVGAGVVISQDMMDNNTYVAQVRESVDVTWAVAKASLSQQASDPIDVDEDLRTAVGMVDDATVTVSVEAFDLDQTRLAVSARKFGVANGEIAEMVFDRILDRLAH